MQLHVKKPPTNNDPMNIAPNIAHIIQSNIIAVRLIVDIYIIGSKSE